MNNYISAKAAATKWDVSNTWITILCSQGRIPGAEKRNGKWMILLWSSIFVTLVAKKYHESVTLPSGLRMVYDNH